MRHDNQYSRTIMHHNGSKKGPLLIVIAGIHGNEKAGIEALRLVGKMLEVEPITNPSFEFKGKMIGLIGNINAVVNSERFIDKDLNRMWSDSVIEAANQKAIDDRTSEEKELLSLLVAIKKEINSYSPESLYILDLHTTSSSGGIFAIPSYDLESERVCKNLFAPVILDLLKDISGTTLHYFHANRFDNVICTALTFEAGQHDDPTSVNRCIAAIVNCLRTIGCVHQQDVESIHDQILISYSEKLPKITRLIYKHDILIEDQFEMLPGFKNFDPVKEGDTIAKDKNGSITVQCDGLILMPLYQKQGAEGFYIVQKVSDPTYTKQVEEV